MSTTPSLNLYRCEPFHLLYSALASACPWTNQSLDVHRRPYTPLVVYAHAVENAWQVQGSTVEEGTAVRNGARLDVVVVGIDESFPGVGEVADSRRRVSVGKMSDEVSHVQRSLVRGPAESVGVLSTKTLYQRQYETHSRPTVNGPSSTTTQASSVPFFAGSYR